MHARPVRAVRVGRDRSRGVGLPEGVGRIDPSAVALAVSRAETGEVSYDEAVDLAEYDRLAGVVADG